MAELKPCPFCGGSVRFDKAFSYFRDSVIYCDDCDMVFTLDDCQASDDEICEAWNTRYLTEYIVKLPEPPKGVQSDDT